MNLKNLGATPRGCANCDVVSYSVACASKYNQTAALHVRGEAFFFSFIQDNFSLIKSLIE